MSKEHTVFDPLDHPSRQPQFFMVALLELGNDYFDSDDFGE